MSFAVTAIIVGAAAVGSIGYGGYAVKRATDEAKRAARNQKKMAAELEARTKANAFQAAMKLQKQRGVVREPGMRDTILTSPTGIVGTGNYGGGKTLLGM